MADAHGGVGPPLLLLAFAIVAFGSFAEATSKESKREVLDLLL
jgi:hypothetical protein